MNKDEFYKRLSEFINSPHETFKTLFLNPENDEIYDSPNIMDIIYKNRIINITRPFINLLKPENMSWKAFYDIVYFLVKNKDSSWLINSLAKSGKIFELELLGFIDSELELTQNDIDDAAAAEQVELLDWIYQNTKMLPDVNILLSERGKYKYKLYDFFKKYNIIANKENLINALNRDPIDKSVIKFYLQNLPHIVDDVFDYAFENDNINLFTKLFDYYMESGKSIYDLLDKTFTKRNVFLANVLIDVLFGRLDKNDSDSNTAIVTYIIMKAKDFAYPLLMDILKKGYKFELSDIATKTILNYNLTKVLKLLATNHIKSQYINKNLVNILKSKLITPEIKYIVREFD